MPLSINVGLSRKASKDYQSTGYSINVTAELDQSLLARPAELQTSIADLYDQARRALDEQTHQRVPEPTSPARQQPAPAARRTVSAGIGGGAGNGNGRPAPPMTASQRRAIESICQRAGLDAATEAQEQFGVEFRALTLPQASRLIDLLKDSATAERNREAP